MPLHGEGLFREQRKLRVVTMMRGDQIIVQEFSNFHLLGKYKCFPYPKVSFISLLGKVADILLINDEEK